VRGTDPGYYPPGTSPTPGTGLDRGHIIGQQLGGSGTDKGSLFAQCPYANRVEMRTFEGRVRKVVDQLHETVYYVVDLKYNGDVKPSRVDIAWTGQHWEDHAEFPNDC
jgi:hypothetical protein